MRTSIYYIRPATGVVDAVISNKKIIFLTLLSLWSSVINAATLNHVAMISNDINHAVFCLTVNGSVAPKVFSLQHPDRVVIDLANTQRIQQVLPSNLRAGIVVNVRSGRPEPDILRLVFDLDRNVVVHTSSCGQNTTQPGLRVDFQARVIQKPISKALAASANTVQAFAKTAKLTAGSATNAVSVTWQMPKNTLRDVVVVIDPGHGGRDSGARGPNASTEKAVVLAIAQQLKKCIDAQPGMHAVLTRTGDYYVGLRERLHSARRYNADIFVAIHADAFGNHESNGASVFALSQNGATSEAARWLAEKENYSELGGVKLSTLDDKNGMIRTVLLDLSQTATIGASVQMGSRVLSNLNSVTRLHHKHVEQARFVVLKSPDIPSVLIETGFITNPREEKNLTDARYQVRLSQAIFAGIKGYFWDHPPRGTRVEAMSNLHRRIVRAFPASTPFIQTSSTV